ncbi:hypothetical protein pdam_00025133 [Pocillopora damicornis]|uniref:Uncharacterized protein n=1 Tax=Pocillopora damicornis TaxID=46731 RepID=A0A3M6TZL2_POCDA|nr:hypothetical protein pdam_00025133 [Pocillopora damicornis]
MSNISFWDHLPCSMLDAYKSVLQKGIVITMQFANLLPFYKSKLMSIHLFCVCKTEHLFNQNYGFNKLIEPLVEDMKILGSEQGYTFSVVNGLGKYYILPSRNAGGFKEGVGGSMRKCRHCMANFEGIQSFFEEQHFQLRSLEEYMQHLMQMEDAACENL